MEENIATELAYDIVAAAAPGLITSNASDTQVGDVLRKAVMIGKAFAVILNEEGLGGEDEEQEAAKPARQPRSPKTGK